MGRPGVWQRVAWLGLLAMSAVAPGRAQTLDLPSRAADALTGDAVAAEIGNLELEIREEMIFEEIVSGNVPEASRGLLAVELVRTIDGRDHQVTFWVTADYLAVGSDADAFYTPLSPQTAQRLADLAGASLPTPFMADAIWAAATRRLEPAPIPPSPAMTTVEVFKDHNRIVRNQLAALTGRSSGIIAGHKKDVVITATLAEAPGKVAIYGWHAVSGEPIQPLYTGHTDRWVDYSHGIRLVHREVSIDGIRHDLIDVLRDETRAALLSDEGVIADPRYPTAVRAELGAQAEQRRSGR